MSFGVDDVVRTGMCVGCGGCAVDNPEVFIGLNDLGYYQATIPKPGDAGYLVADSSCPFSDATPDETEVAADLGPTCQATQDLVDLLASLRGA